jgi:hypothetical protein
VRAYLVGVGRERFGGGARAGSEPLFTPALGNRRMATETADRRAEHRRSITVTSVVSLAGIAAGVASSALTAGPTDDLGLVVLAAFTFASLGVMRVLGIDVGEFSTKDHLYVWFMSFALWFVTWGILLTADAGF